MSTTFTAFMKELQREAEAEGPEAVAELRSCREHFRRVRRLVPAGASPAKARRE